MKPMLRWMAVALASASVAGCYYYPDYGYVRGNGYGTAPGVYYDDGPLYDGPYYDAAYYGAPYVGTYYGGYGVIDSPYGYYGSYYWPGYYSIGVDVHHWSGHDGWGRGHDARPSHRAGPEVQSRRRR